MKIGRDKETDQFQTCNRVVNLGIEKDLLGKENLSIFQFIINEWNSGTYLPTKGGL